MKLRRKSRKYYGPVCGGAWQKPRAIAFHSTEGPTAAGAAAYLKTRPDGSVHYVVDDVDCFYTQTPRKTACGIGGLNTGIIHVEQAGFASWSRKQWLRRLRTLRRAAYWAAVEMRKRGIPCRRLKSKADLENRGGYFFHADATRVGFPTTHTDPGPHYPYLKMGVLVHYYYHRIGRRRH